MGQTGPSSSSVKIEGYIFYEEHILKRHLEGAARTYSITAYISVFFIFAVHR